mmetsp:Transcript_17370/g.40516  ORF Transcript_17370/g.40516 Transcript_17370/m.40516 type:complete len:394 (-) Transcript_17370:23-1204(-)
MSSSPSIAQSSSRSSMSSSSENPWERSWLRNKASRARPSTADAEGGVFAHDELAPNKDWLKQMSGSSNGSTSSTTARSIEELSSESFFTQHCADIDSLASRVIDECSIKEVIQAVVTDGQFCISIADPRAPDVPLIAVSDQFEAMTGYRREEVLGKNCRLLNMGCDIDFLDLVNLRIASKTGASFTGVLPNRRKSGEMFLNLLDLRGLTVATNRVTGEELWFLVGIQADVTNLNSLGSRTSCLREMHAVANGIRMQLGKELSELAVSAALVCKDGKEADQISSAEDLQFGLSDGWSLLPTPSWRPEAFVPQGGPEFDTEDATPLCANLDCSWDMKQEEPSSIDCTWLDVFASTMDASRGNTWLPVTALKVVAATGLTAVLVGQLSNGSKRFRC